MLFASVYIIADRRIAPEREYHAFFYGFFIAVFAYTIVLTTGKENVIVMVSVLFAPVALGIKNLEKKISLAEAEERGESPGSAEHSDVSVPAKEAETNE